MTVKKITWNANVRFNKYYMILFLTFVNIHLEGFFPNMEINEGLSLIPIW